MKPKITETELNQEFKRLGFINGLAYKIIGRKYNITAHGIEVKASKMRKKGTLIKIGGKNLKILELETLKVLFDEYKEKEENLKVAIRNGLTKEEAEVNYDKWKESYIHGNTKPESHVGKLHTTVKKENKPLESNSSSKDKNVLESVNNSQETCIKQKLELKPYEKELVDKLVEKHSSEPQVKESVNIPKITTLKPVTMEGQNSVYTFNKHGVKINTLNDTPVTPELLREQQEALELWNLHYKELG